MLWVLKKNLSMRRFFWAPKTYVQIDGLENINNLSSTIFFLSKSMGYRHVEDVPEEERWWKKKFFW